MKSDAGHRGVSVGLIASAMTATAIVLSVTAGLAAMRLAGGSAGAAAAVCGVAIAWAANLAGLWFMGRWAAGENLLQGYLAGLMVRGAICVFGSVTAVGAGGLAIEPLLVSMGGAYLPLLVIESVMLARAVDRAGGATGGGA